MGALTPFSSFASPNKTNERQFLGRTRRLIIIGQSTTLPKYTCEKLEENIDIYYYHYLPPLPIA